MCHQVQPQQNVRALRQALGQFATGVAIVTAADPRNRPLGMTINSFSSVSLSPALVAWCVDRSAASYRGFATADRFCITVLADDQQELAQRFATRGADKFHDIRSDAQGPRIEGGCARFECVTYRRVLLGDHLMIIGRVERFDAQPASPLLFVSGRLIPVETDKAKAAA